MEFLTFILGGEEYGLPILQVQEIRGWEEPTPMPESPDFVKGVINLRGRVVPIVDLRDRFHLDASYNDTTVVIVVRIQHDTGEKVIGIVVDAVSEVYNIKDDEIQSAPNVRGAIGAEFVQGLSTVENKMLILLNIDSLVTEGLIQQAASVA